MPLDPNATTIREIEKTFASVLRENLYGGEELVVIEPFHGSRPAKPHASIMLVWAHAEPHEVYEYEDRDDGEFWEGVKGERFCRMRIQFFDTGARQKAIDCQNLLRSSNRNFDIVAITGFGGIGDVQEFSTEYLGKQEERAYLDVEFYANLSAEYKSNWIEKVRGDIVHDGTNPQPYDTGGDSCKLTFGSNKGK